MLTIEKIKQYNIPINISKPNNIGDTYFGGAHYNDSLNIYEAVKFLQESLGASLLSVTHQPSSITLTLGVNDTLVSVATTSLAGVMSASDKTSLTNLVTLSGVSTSNLGTFTGTTISDNTTIKNALQQLEIKVESLGSNLLTYDYSNSGTTYTLSSTMTYLVNQGGNLQVTVGPSMSNLTPHYVFVRQVSNNSLTFVTTNPNSIWSDGASPTETGLSYGITGATNYHTAFMLIRNNNIIFITRIQ